MPNKNSDAFKAAKSKLALVSKLQQTAAQLDNLLIPLALEGKDEKYNEVKTKYNQLREQISQLIDQSIDDWIKGASEVTSKISKVNTLLKKDAKKIENLSKTGDNVVKVLSYADKIIEIVAKII